MQLNKLMILKLKTNITSDIYFSKTNVVCKKKMKKLK